MTVLVVGASGATGRLLVQQLLARGRPVKAVVRSLQRLPGALRAQPRLTLVGASVPDLDAAALAEHLRGCVAVASCLGHTTSWAGLFGPPRRLVTDATRRLCAAVRAGRPGPGCASC